MWRFSIVNTPVSGLPQHVVCFVVGGKALVKHIVSDGTAQAANTIADVTVNTDTDGRKAQVDVNADALSAANRTTIKTWLTGQGIPNGWLDSTITDRRKLLIAVLQKVAGRLDVDVSTLRAFLAGYDVSDEAVPVYVPPPIPAQPVFTGH